MHLNTLEKKLEVHMKHFCILKYSGCLEKKNCVLFDLWVEQVACLVEHHFYLKEWQTGYLKK